jgi:hypothetical protein
MAKYSGLVDNLGAGAQIGIRLHGNGNYEFAFMKITQTTPCFGWIVGGRAGHQSVRGRLAIAAQRNFMFSRFP